MIAAAGHPDQPRRQDQPRGGGRPRHGQDLRLRRRGARRRHQGRRFTAADGTVVSEGDVISIDGTTGEVYLGEVPVVASPVVEYFEGGLDPVRRRAGRGGAPDHAGTPTRERRLGVRANADNGEDAARAGRFGAQGIGLCRTEHMFLGERRAARRAADPGRGRRRPAGRRWTPCCRCSAATSSEILEAMDGLPVTIRLLDPPLHEFLPDLTELSVRVALAEATRPPTDGPQLLEAVRRLHEQNPMLGLRGVRLGLVIPGLFAHAGPRDRRGGRGPASRPAATRSRRSWSRWSARCRSSRRPATRSSRCSPRSRRRPAPTCPRLIGTMIELPRAALTAGQIAEAAEFFSFGTNDLTQTGWGFSRDDVEGAFFGRYLELGIFGVSPFETLDRDGVGRLVQIAVEEGRATRPGLKLGVCGEHGGDPDSVHFFHEAGLDYVSCSPFRVPVARLEAGPRRGPGGRGGQRQPVTAGLRRPGGTARWAAEPSKQARQHRARSLHQGPRPGAAQRRAAPAGGQDPGRRGGRGRLPAHPADPLAGVRPDRPGARRGARLRPGPGRRRLPGPRPRPPAVRPQRRDRAGRARRGLRRVRGERAEPAAADPPGGQGARRRA